AALDHGCAGNGGATYPTLCGFDACGQRSDARWMMASTSQRTFRVALTADFYNDRGELPYKDMGLSVFDGQSQLEYFALADKRPEIGADQIGDANAIVVLMPAVTRQTLSNADNLLVIGRFGVGYEKVDVAAC